MRLSIYYDPLLIVDEGKSVYLLYMVRRRCAERKPVIWYDGLVGYVFVDDGVYKMAPVFHVNEFKVFVWTLVDSATRPRSESYSSLCPLCFFPNIVRWKRLHKTMDDFTVIMNTWTWREMFRACVCHTLRYSFH